MCGVFGIVSQEDPVDREALAKGTLALRRRGPDAEGIWLSPDGLVGLGHRRLAVLDLEGGAQPLSSEDGNVTAVVNGELYGFSAIRAGLLARGHVFRTGGDSEILVHLYEEEGPSALRHLRGEFAFLLWDQRRRRLFAARDRFGIKPLSYGLHGGALHLASTAKALFAAGFPAAWDHAALFQASSLQYPLPGRTLFRGISQLPPGHYLLAWPGGVSVHRYWDMDYPASQTREPARAELTLLERTGDAVRVRLRADVPVAFQLSGGIDSSAVVALAARELGAGLPCFTVGFDEADRDQAGYDEAELAAEVARHVGARHHVIRVGGDDIARHFEASVTAGEGLAINGHITAKYMLSRAIREAGYKVVLTGEGADEVLCGYAHLRQDLRGSPSHLESTNRAQVGIMLPGGASLSLSAVEERLGFVPTWLLAKGSLGHRIRGVLREEWMRSEERPDPFAELVDAVDVAGQLKGRERPLQSIYLWSKLALEGYILRTLGDGMEMAHSIEGRLPFLDHELFAWLKDLPLSLKIRGGTEKHVLREAMRPLLPASVVSREKHPFLAPPHLGSGNPAMRALLFDTLGSSAARSLPFFDLAKVRAIAERAQEARAERTALDPVLFFFLSACALHEHLHLSEGQ